MPNRLLLVLLALACTMVAQRSSAETFTAGERRLATASPTAAARNHGDSILRLIIWYPASQPETQVTTGPPRSPIFIAGAVARDAPFANAAARYPLILLSHGFGGSARQMSWLGTALARHGYLAVAVDHPGANSIDGVSDAGAYAPWVQATDLRAALDFVLARSEFAEHIDNARVGVAGFALGGYASLLAAGARSDFGHFVTFCEGPDRDNMCNKQLEYPLDYHRRTEVLARPDLQALAAGESADFRDPRIKALFLVAPAFVQALDPASISRIRVPVAVVFGGDDLIAPAATNGQFVARLIPGARSRPLTGIGHYDFLSKCGPGGFKFVAPLCVDGPGATRANTHAVTEAEGIAFFDATLGGDQQRSSNLRSNLHLDPVDSGIAGESGHSARP